MKEPNYKEIAAEKTLRLRAVKEMLKEVLKYINEKERKS